MNMLWRWILVLALSILPLAIARAQKDKELPQERAYVGMRVSPLDDRLADALAVPKNGRELVQNVTAGSPADLAGVKPGDLIVAVENISIDTANTVSRLIARFPVGVPIELTITRGARDIRIPVTPVVRPSEEKVQAPTPVRWFAAPGVVSNEEGPDVPVLGMTLKTLTPSSAAQLKLPTGTRGAVLSFVSPASDAAQLGLSRGDVIRGIGNVPVTTAIDAAARLVASTSGGRAALITVQRGANQLGYLGLRAVPDSATQTTAIVAPEVAVSTNTNGAVTVTSTTAASGPRLALIIGNSAYGPQLGPLANPASDARLVANRLKAVGFDVELLMDGDQKAMKRAISRLGERMTAAGRGSTGLFYFAGHGMQSRGQNYLIPVGAAIEREADVDLEAVAADTVLAQMEEAGAATNIIILDACRNTPVLRKFRSGVRGLARMEAPNGSFISYSTAPGSVAFDGDGSNSPFATALATEFDRPGQPIELTFRNVRRSVLQATAGAQTPWDSSSLTDTFMFKP